jgi:hypothetical protein
MTYCALAIPGQCGLRRRTRATERNRLRAARCVVGNEKRPRYAARSTGCKSHIDSAVRSKTRDFSGADA